MSCQSEGHCKRSGVVKGEELLDDELDDELELESDSSPEGSLGSSGPFGFTMLFSGAAVSFGSTRSTGFALTMSMRGGAGLFSLR